jgi:uncharacterized membrane protein
MPDYTRSITIDRSADETFAYVREVRHLPEYFEHMVSAEPADQGEAVHVTADVFGEKEEGEAWFRVDDGRRRVEWGSERKGSDYEGWIEVGEEGDGAVVRLGLHMHQPDVDDSIDKTLENLRSRIGG